MVTPLPSHSHLTSIENLLGTLPEDDLGPLPEDEAPHPRRGLRPLITMGDSADSGDSAGASTPAGGLRGAGRCFSLSIDQPEPPGATRSAPDIERSPDAKGGYRLLAPSLRCSCSRLPRASSRESVRSGDALVVAPTAHRDRIIRQHSQPETCLRCHQPKPSASSLRLLPRHEHSPGEGISSIVADSLRINGALRHFKQVGAVFFRWVLRGASGALATSRGSAAGLPS